MSQRTTQLLRYQHDVSMSGSSIAVAARSPNAGATRNTRTAPSRNPIAKAARPYATPAFVAFVHVRAMTQEDAALSKALHSRDSRCIKCGAKSKLKSSLLAEVVRAINRANFESAHDVIDGADLGYRVRVRAGVDRV